MPPGTNDPYSNIATPIPAAVGAVAPAVSTTDASDPYAKIATPVTQPSMLSKLASTGEDVAAGFAKGAGDTVSGVSHLINKIPGVGETLAPSEGVSALDQMDVSKNTAQSVGKGAEGIAEFAAGDEALEGLSKATKLVSLASKYPMVAETLRLATAHPWLAKIITEGAKGAVVGGAEGTVKGAQQNQAVKGGEHGAALGAALGSAKGAVQGGAKAYSALRQNPFRTAINQFTGSDIQPALKSGIQDVWNKVADEAGVPHPTASSVRDMGDEVGDSILARSKQTYAKIDAATDNRWSGTEEKLRNVRQALRSVTNDNEEAPLLVDKTRYEMQLSQMLDDAAKQPDGFTRADVEAAKSDFKQAQAVYDTNQHIRMTTTGVRAGAPGAEATPETVNAKGLVNRLEKQYEPKGGGRIQQALGEDNSRDLIGHASTAEKAGRTTARNAKAGKYIAGTVGVGGVAELYHTLAK